MLVVLGLPVNLVLLCVSTLLVAITAALLLRRKMGNSCVSKEGAKTAPVTANGKAAKKVDDVPPVDPSKPCIRLLYGTQTGTAERFAKQLGKELGKKYGDSTHIEVVDIENYNAAERLEKEKLVIVTMATYGDGEPTDSAADFYGWLTKTADSVESGEREPLLKGTSYAVFGLGNKQYEHFNQMGKMVFKHLGAMGGAPLLRRGDGDDDASIDDDFEKWCLELHEALDARSDLVGAKADQSGQAAALSPSQVPAYEVQVLPASAKQAPAFTSGAGLDAHRPFTAAVALVRELHGPGSERSCVHAEVDVSGSGIKYEHGDHIAIHAQNSPAVVSEVAAMLGASPESIITLRKPAGAAGLDAPPFAGPLSLRSAIAHFADVLASPHKDNLLALAAFTKDPAEAARLVHLASAEGKAEYGTYVAKAHRSLLEVMRDFPSARPPVGAFFGSVAARLQPRFYSISSSPALHPETVHVTCAVVRDTMPTGRVHEGVASTWLQRCTDVPRVPVSVFVRHSHFKLPKDPSTPIIMVGPGTGLAPFRGFLQERASMQQSGTGLGPAVLFFGCRTSAHDYIYRDELEGWLAQGVVSELHVAFSRDSAAKDYVQHHMERNAGALWALLSGAGAHLYVCGDAKAMAKDVHRALLALVQAGKGCSGTQAEAFVKELQDAGRYQRDVW